jgi:hypothetical protein
VAAVAIAPATTNKQPSCGGFGHYFTQSFHAGDVVREETTRLIRLTSTSIKQEQMLSKFLRTDSSSSTTTTTTTTTVWDRLAPPDAGNVSKEMNRCRECFQRNEWKFCGMIQAAK